MRSESNPECDLTMVDKPFRKIVGTWPYLVDFSSKCTSIVNSVISALLVDISADGTLDKLWEHHLSAASNIDCSESPYYAAKSESATQYEISDLAGAFYIYVAFALLALLVHARKIAQHYYTVKKLNSFIIIPEVKDVGVSDISASKVLDLEEVDLISDEAKETAVVVDKVV